MEEFYNNVGEMFENNSSSPLSFLEGNSEASGNFLHVCKLIYDFHKETEAAQPSDPLPKLIIENFDDEQVWQEIDMFNKTEAVSSLKAVDLLVSKKRRVFLTKRKINLDVKSAENEETIASEDEEDQNVEDNSEQSDSSNDEEDGFIFEESEEEENERGDHGEVVERTEVDDDFFSLRNMEKFLEQQDRIFENDLPETNNEEIDYFEDVESSEDEDVEDEEEEHDVNDSDMKSSRHLLYSDYFDSPIHVDEAEHDKAGENDMTENAKQVRFAVEEIKNKPASSFETQQEQIGKKIEILENKSLEAAPWQMKGEIKASQRPENSLLQEMLTFDHVARPPTEITEEHTKDLESLIRQRILDCAWDDVERKIKPAEKPDEYKKRITLDSSQSKLTLGEIYEKEYLEKNKKNEEEFEEKESEAHAEIRKEMKDLFRKLDALSNFHFIASIPEPEIKIISNLPSIAMEEVQPVTHTEGQTLAPEEIFEKSGTGEIKSAKEKSSTDNKRERRKKKMRMKVRAKAHLEKMKLLDPNSAKVKKMQAINDLKNAAKAPGGNTTILKSTATSSEKLTSSNKFFSQLQDRSIPKAASKRKKMKS